MKKFIIVLLSFVGLIVLLAVAVVAAPNFIDWNGYKPEIAAAVKEQTGRDVTIGGDIHFKLVPRVAFAISDVKLSNGEGFGDMPMLTLESMRGTVALFPLILRRVRVEELVVTKPVLNLEVDRTGRANWVLGAEAPASAKPERRSAGGTGLPFSDLTLGDVRLADGQVTYRDARTGQQVVARAINAKAALANLDSPLSVAGDMTLNGEPVALKLGLNSLGGLEDGRRATLNSALQSRHIQVTYDGGLRQKPIAALDGTFDLSIPSVGSLANWLQRPLAKGQPDPGPLKIHAVFEGEGARMVLKEARIEGAAAQARASGLFDGSGKVRRVKFDLQAGVIDLDRYLPPPAKTPAAKRKPEPRRQAGARDVLAAIPDDPFDLAPLKQTAGEIAIRIDGVRAMGYTLGRIGFDAKFGDGRLAADLKEFRLYGGNMTGAVKLDASGAALGADTAFDIEKVDVGALARAAQGAEARVAGILSGKLRAKAQGKSPRKLVEGLVTRVELGLGGVDVKDAPGAVSKLDLTVDVPGMQQGAAVKADVVYNKQPVSLALNLAPLPRVLSGKPFATKLSVNANALRFSYDGNLQTEPVPGMDGRLSLDVTSVEKLLAWLGSPLPKGQPDPGPVKVAAVLAADGAKAELKEATIDGKALKVKAVARVDASKPVKQFDATIDLVDADLNAYLPADREPKKKQPAAASPAGWSDTPVNLSALHQAEGKATVRIGRVRYGDVRIEAGTATATLTKATLQAVASKVGLAGGTLDLNATVAATKGAPSIEYQLKLSGVQARPVLQTFAGTDRLSGQLDFRTAGQTTGASQKRMVEKLNGEGRFVFKDGAIHGINIPGALRKAKTLGLGEARGEKTDFAELSGSYTIKDGILENRDLKMLAPLVRVTGAGRAPMPPRTVDYRAEAKLVATLEGQGGKDALAGLPIPITVKGSWDKPAIGVDWKSVLTSAASDPQRLANMPGELRNLGKGLGIPLPSPDKGAAGDILKSIPGLPGVKQQAPPPTSPDQAPAKKEAPDPLKTFRDLLGK